MQHFLLLLLALTASGAEAAPRKKPKPAPAPAAEAQEPDPAPEIKWSVGAALDLQGQYFPEAIPTTEQSFGIANADLNGTVKVGHSFLVKARPTGHLDPNNPSKTEQSWYDLPEGYAQLKGSLSEDASFLMQLGFNTFTWGVTDGYNPVDVVSARRYADPLNSEKLGAFSFLGRLDFGSVLLEGIFIPWQRRSVLPGEKSRWLPRELGGPIQYAGAVTDLPSAPDFSFGDYKSLDSALKNNFGFRASSHLLGMDTALYYFNGASTIPAVQYTLDVTATAIDPSTFQVTRWSAGKHITLTPVYNRVQVGGASLMFPIWELIARTEVAVTRSKAKGSPAITEKDTEALLELEHTFTGEKSTFTVIGLAAYADPQDNGGQVSGSPTLNRLFDRAAGLGARWQPTDDYSLESYAAFDTLHGGSLYNAQLSHKLSDAWKIYAGGQYFKGKANQPVGVYRHNSRVSAGLKVSL